MSLLHDRKFQLFSGLKVSTAAGCGGLNLGSISATATGGVLPYTFDIRFPDGSSQTVVGSTVSLTNLAPGTYFLTLTDGGGCSSVTSATIAESNIAIAFSYSGGRETPFLLLLNAVSDLSFLCRSAYCQCDHPSPIGLFYLCLDVDQWILCFRICSHRSRPS